MKIISLGGGALTVKNIRISRGMTADAFVSSTEFGTEILEKLKKRSARILWGDELGRIDWADRLGLVNWFLQGDM